MFTSSSNVPNHSPTERCVFVNWSNCSVVLPLFHQSEHYFLGYPSSLLSTTNHHIHPWKLFLAWDLIWRRPHYPLWVWWCAGGGESSGPETMWWPRNMGGSCDQQLPNLCDLQPTKYFKSKLLTLQHQRGAMMFLVSMSFCVITSPHRFTTLYLNYIE